MKVILMALAALIVCGPVMAQDKALNLELAQDHVDITTGFNGTSIVVFGTRASDASSLVVTLKGPEKTTIIRRKGRVAGAWMNRDSMEFRRVPSYYDYASTLDDAALDQIASLRADGAVGVDYLGFYPEDDGEEVETVSLFEDALIRGMQQKGFYPIKGKAVNVISGQLFKVSFDLPPGVPTGLYTVEAMAVDNGVISARESRTLQVGQVGFNARVYLFAEQHSFFYGVFAVFLALASGWSAFTFLRRD